jgi:hypothetical protein
MKRITPKNQMNKSLKVEEPELAACLFIARRFHEVYEEWALEFGWTTQEKSRTPWESLPSENKALMVNTVYNLLRESTIAMPANHSTRENA